MAREYRRVQENGNNVRDKIGRGEKKEKKGKARVVQEESEI